MTDLATLAASVDLSTVGPAILTVGGALIGVAVTILGVKKVLGFVRRG